MTKVTNKGRERLHFAVEGNGKSFLDPGETADLDLRDPDSPENTARVHVGLITIGGPSKAKKASTKSTAGTAAAGGGENKA